MAQKLALITGGAQGIGLACAEALVEDGATVILADIQGDKAAEAARKLGGYSYSCDMSDLGAVDDLFDRVEADHGALSVLVNNAGVAIAGDVLTQPVEDFQKVINLNLTSVFVATQRAAKGMIAAEIEGAIVNMSSVNAQVAIPSIPAYCASKGGVMQLTKSSALALAPHGIRVNAVGPGSIDTDMLTTVNANPDAMAMVMSRTPLKRIGTPREIGDVVAFLASDKASYITGETIYVDAGRLAMNYTC